MATPQTKTNQECSREFPNHTNTWSRQSNKNKIKQD